MRRIILCAALVTFFLTTQDAGVAKQGKKANKNVSREDLTMRTISTKIGRQLDGTPVRRHRSRDKSGDCPAQEGRSLCDYSHKNPGEDGSRSCGLDVGALVTPIRGGLFRRE
jgi:hypothetical protein